MKKIWIVLISLLEIICSYSQEIYSKCYGDPKLTPIIFLHGGPGYNSVNFEVSTAQKLADNGFYVIVYDRRAEGRSKNMEAEFTFKQTFKDIDALFKKYKNKKGKSNWA